MLSWGHISLSVQSSTCDGKRRNRLAVSYFVLRVFCTPLSLETGCQSCLCEEIWVRKRWWIKCVWSSSIRAVRNGVSLKLLKEKIWIQHSIAITLDYTIINTNTYEYNVLILCYCCIFFQNFNRRASRFVEIRKNHKSRFHLAMPLNSCSKLRLFNFQFLLQVPRCCCWLLPKPTTCTLSPRLSCGTWSSPTKAKSWSGLAWRATKSPPPPTSRRGPPPTRPYLSPRRSSPPCKSISRSNRSNSKLSIRRRSRYRRRSPK